MKTFLIVCAAILGAIVSLGALAIWLLVPGSPQELLAVAGGPVLVLLVFLAVKLVPDAPSRPMAPAAPPPPHPKALGVPLWQRAGLATVWLLGFGFSLALTGVVIAAVLKGPTAMPWTDASKAEKLFQSADRELRSVSSWAPCRERALASISDAVRLEPDVAKYRLSFGIALANCRRIDQAAIEFENALRLDPTLSKASQFLTRARREIAQRQADAIRDAIN
jgi:hypothetical protein